MKKQIQDQITMCDSEIQTISAQLALVIAKKTSLQVMLVSAPDTEA